MAEPPGSLRPRQGEQQNSGVAEDVSVRQEAVRPPRLSLGHRARVSVAVSRGAGEDCSGGKGVAPTIGSFTEEHRGQRDGGNREAAREVSHTYSCSDWSVSLLHVYSSLCATFPVTAGCEVFIPHTSFQPLSYNHNLEYGVESNKLHLLALL